MYRTAVTDSAIGWKSSWVMMYLLLGLTVSALAQRVANQTLKMPEVPPTRSYEVVDALPGLRFANPVALVAAPQDETSLFVVEKVGRVKRIQLGSEPIMEVFLDLRSQTRVSSEQGLLGLAFHPQFHENGYFFVFYTATGSGSPNRLSRFQCDLNDGWEVIENSEVILISQRDDASNHNGGDLHFGPDGYLYVALGDEGAANDSLNNSQKLDADFFAGILRLDVDQRPGSLEPQPHPAVMGHYSIPPDNPFVGLKSLNGVALDPAQLRTEFWAIGLRNPWRMSFDSVTGDLYTGDVGQNRIEEVNRITRGGNYGWNFLEGTQNGPKARQMPRDFESIPPLLEYRHGTREDQGNSITGGLVYRGNQYPDLYGAYVFADYVSGHIWAMRHDGKQSTQWWNLARESGISSFGLDPTTGHLLMTDHGSGKVLRLVSSSQEPGQPLPETLSQTGVFADLRRLTPNPGIEPYEINVPFWSDHAIKRRWFSLPRLDQSISVVSPTQWAFPAGAVWVKHFEMEMVRGDPSTARRLETRLLMRHAEGVYGLTYRWNEDQDEAFLVAAEGEETTLRIREGNQFVDQIWRFPSRGECLACHNQPAGMILGFQPPQLDRERGPASGNQSQLEWLKQAGYLNIAGSEGSGKLSAMVPSKDASASLTRRIKSYLASNCASCHRPGGEALGFWDARYQVPILESGLLDGALAREEGRTDLAVIRPGDPERSAIYLRMLSQDSGRMPPIGNHVADEAGIALMAEWIRSLSDLQSFDSWNQHYFQGAMTPVEHQLQDVDRDGWTNWQEFQLGSDPTWEIDRWRMDLQVVDQVASLRFPAIPNPLIGWKLTLSSAADSLTEPTLLGERSTALPDQGIHTYSVEILQHPQAFFHMAMEWPASPLPEE